MASISLTSIGVIVGSVCLNPIIIGSISGTGIVIQGYLKQSNINEKIYQRNFAFASYQKILTQIRSYLNGLPYDETIFLSDVKVIDNITTDICSPIGQYSEKYGWIYGKL